MGIGTMKGMLPRLDGRTRKRRLQDFEARCRDLKVPLTSQRRVILTTVLDLGSHPTAEDVFAAPPVRRARISRATVYRTLESLARIGCIGKACHAGGVVRYDGRIEMHHHLICIRCDAVFDIADPALDSFPIPDVSAFGFDLQDFRVQLRGICRRCRKQED
jgi:Fur family peroxide stress response transcriptional regulator